MREVGVPSPGAVGVVTKSSAASLGEGAGRRRVGTRAAARLRACEELVVRTGRAAGEWRGQVGACRIGAAGAQGTGAVADWWPGTGECRAREATTRAATDEELGVRLGFHELAGPLGA